MRDTIHVRVVLAILIIALLAAGCSRPGVQTAASPPSADVPPAETIQENPVMVTAQRYQSGKILITYRGGPDADRLIELQTTVITKIGSVNIQSMGSRADTTPVQIGGTDIFQGPFTDEVHVLTNAYYVNGTHRDVLDTWI